MNITENIKQAKEARRSVTDHCMAAKVEENASHLLVTFPPGFSLGGVRVTKTNGIVWACEKAVEKMEQVWCE